MRRCLSGSLLRRASNCYSDPTGGLRVDPRPVDDRLKAQVASLIVIETLSSSDLQAHRELVSRVVSSSAICKSARLKDLFLYLCHRALDDGANDIHELELGHKVFGRAEHYDTIADNIVRVHASLLRKRLAEYFDTEGAKEPVVVEIPRGNYAPVFSKREVRADASELARENDLLILEPRSTLLEPSDTSLSSLATEQTGRSIGARWELRSLAALTLGFALISIFLRDREHLSGAAGNPIPTGTTVRQFWSAIFSQGTPTQVVLDDASLDFYQEATGRSVTLAEYFDRSYQRPMEQAAIAAHLDPGLVHEFLSRRQSNFADINLAGSLAQTASAFGSSASIQFARDFSFRQLKSGDVILLGTRQSNPWIQPFDSFLAVRWKYDPPRESYYPSDITTPSDPDKFRSSVDGGKTHDGYAGIAFLPNLGGTGNVLIVMGSGGAAITAALSFLTNEASMKQLRSRLNSPSQTTFPNFEALIRIEKGDSLSRSGTIVLARPPQPLVPASLQTAAQSHQ